MKKLMGEQLNQREIDEILRDVDLNGDGLVDFEGVCVLEKDRERYIFKKARCNIFSFFSCRVCPNDVPLDEAKMKRYILKKPTVHVQN